MHDYIVIEQRKDGTKTIHEFNISKKFYISSISLDSFMCGSPRKFASKKDVQFYRGAPNWGPHAVFHLNRLDKFLEDEARNEDALKHFGLPYVSLASLPRIAHASLFDFYKHISYDYKNRVYLDSLGKPIVYSYL